MQWSRSYRDPDLPAEPIKLKKSSTANTEMQVATIIGVLGRRSRALRAVAKALWRVGDWKPATSPNSFNHATILPASSARANGPRVTFDSVRWYSRDYAAGTARPNGSFAVTAPEQHDAPRTRARTCCINYRSNI